MTTFLSITFGRVARKPGVVETGVDLGMGVLVAEYLSYNGD